MIIDQRYVSVLRNQTGVDFASADLSQWSASFKQAYLHVQELHARGAHNAALAACAHMIRVADTATVQVACRVYAERMWDVDLRRYFPYVRSALLRASDGSPGTNECETALAMTMLGDFELCRGLFAEGAQTISAARKSVEEMTHDDQWCRISLEATWALARARELQGERRWLEAVGELEDARYLLDSSQWWLDAQLILRITRTHLMQQDLGAAQRALTDFRETDVERGRPEPHSWDAIELERQFVEGELAMVARDLPKAERALRRALGNAQKQGAREVEAELWVHLMRVGVLGADLSLAREASRGARAAVSTDIDEYEDILNDLGRIEASVRFRHLSAQKSATSIGVERWM
jgi:hypothetical protein